MIAHKSVRLWLVFPIPTHVGDSGIVVIFKSWVVDDVLILIVILIILFI
jgi:hypothetical protein